MATVCFAPGRGDLRSLCRHSACRRWPNHQGVRESYGRQVRALTIRSQRHGSGRVGARRHPGSDAREERITAALQYRDALFEFAEGRLAWSELLTRCQALRMTMRHRTQSAS